MNHTLRPHDVYDQPFDVFVNPSDPFTEILKEIKAAQSYNAIDPISIGTTLSTANQASFLALLKDLNAHAIHLVNIKRLHVFVFDGIKFNAFVERRLLQSANDAPFPLAWDYKSTKENVIPENVDRILGSLFFLSEEGQVEFNAYFTKEAGEAMKAIRENNVPWSLKFINTEIKENEILSDKEIHRLAMRAPAMVRLRQFWRTVQRFVRKVSRLRARG